MYNFSKQSKISMQSAGICQCDQVNLIMHVLKCMFFPSLLIFKKCFHPLPLSFLVLIPKPLLVDLAAGGISYLNIVEINHTPALFKIRLGPRTKKRQKNRQKHKHAIQNRKYSYFMHLNSKLAFMGQIFDI